MNKMEALEKENCRLRKRTDSLEHKITNLTLENTNIRKAIERARQNKNRIGAELALRELIIDIKEGNISTKYRDEETIKMLKEKWNGN